MGLTNQPMTAILPVARAWLRPATLKLSGDDFADDGYNPDDRAYHLHRLSNVNTRAEFDIQANERSPVVNLALVVDGWGDGGASLRLNGKPIAEGKDFRVGHIDRLEGSSLVVWVRTQLTTPSHLSLTPTKDSH